MFKLISSTYNMITRPISEASAEVELHCDVLSESRESRKALLLAEQRLVNLEREQELAKLEAKLNQSKEGEETTEE